MKTETKRKGASKQGAAKGKKDAAGANGGGAANGGGGTAANGGAGVAAAVADTTTADGELICTTETTLTNEQLLELYRYLLLTRLVEERLVNLYRQTKVVGGVFRSLGQEATAVGTCYALESRDFIAPLIRDLGAVLVKGIRPREIFAQYMAKAWGPSEGRDLNIHFGNMEKGFIGPISHLGDMIPVMTGIALGARMQGKDIVAL
ncbi:MAG TPA: thiamine pyrophosphate-dependent enzyme, partial [Pyrinomonadaceae bacterium]